MCALTEKHAGRTVQLGYDNTLRTIDDERALIGHIRDGPEIHVLNGGVEVFMIRVRAIQLELRFERHTVCEAAIQAFLD